MFDDVSFNLTLQEVQRLRNTAAALQTTVGDVLHDGVVFYLRALEMRHNRGRPFPQPSWKRRGRIR